MFNMSYQISQNVLLLQETQAATADNLRDTAPPALGWLSWGHYCTQSKPTHAHARTPIDTHVCMQGLVADNSHPVIFDCGPLMLDRRHLAHNSVGLGPPGAPLPPQIDGQGVTSALQNKQKSLCLKSM